LSSSPTLSSSALSASFYHTRSFAEGPAAQVFPLIHRPVTTASLTAPSSWLATTNPGFSSIWLPISHHCSYHQNSSTTTSDGDRLTGNHASFSDWWLCILSDWSPSLPFLFVFCAVVLLLIPLTL
jgi:hypothetical protein